MLNRCPSCLGAKKVMGLGMIQVSCTECAGIGFVKPELELEDLVTKKEVVKKVRKASIDDKEKEA